MATALDMIKRSLRLARVIGADQVLTASEADDALNVYNAMLDAMSIERLMVYEIQQLSYSWPSGQRVRTIGTAGQLVTPYPIRIEAAFITVDSQDFPIEILEDRRQYDSIPDKTQTSSHPLSFFWDKTYPTANMYLYPVPSGNITLKLNVWRPLQSFTSLTTDLSLPPGYQRMIEYNGAVELAPEYGKEVSASVLANARQSKAAIKSVNTPALVSQLDPGLSSRRHAHNIYIDE
jgi:hypothetical protein